MHVQCTRELRSEHSCSVHLFRSIQDVSELTFVTLWSVVQNIFSFFLYMETGSQFIYSVIIKGSSQSKLILDLCTYFYLQWGSIEQNFQQNNFSLCEILWNVHIKHCSSVNNTYPVIYVLHCSTSSSVLIQWQ